MLKERGAITKLEKESDNESELMARLAQTGNTDDVIVKGGASAGKYDFAKLAFTRLGGKIVVDSIPVRPGEPTWFGSLGAQRVIGLQGNPMAAAVIAALFLSPVLRRQSAITLIDATSSVPLGKNGPRECYERARYAFVGGSTVVITRDDQDTSREKVLAEANFLIHRPAFDAEKELGSTIEIVILEQ